jgi:hypothetical protein
MVLSAGTALVFKKRPLGNFLGLLAPTFLLIGLYNKVIKMEEQISREHDQTLH